MSELIEHSRSDIVGSEPRTAGTMYYVYILRSQSSNKYYVGCTDNMERRIQEHNSGASKFTKNKGPWKTQYKEEFHTLAEARARERKIKSWKKRAAVEKLIKHGPIV